MKKRIRRGNPQKQRHWEEVVRRWREGGQSVRAFCRDEGLRESAFYFWRRELARRGQHTCKPDTSWRLPGAVNGSRPQARPATPTSQSSTRVSLRHGPATSFLPVQVVESASRRPGVAESGRPLAGRGVEIVLAQGRTVRVQAGFDRQTLADVLAVLEGRPC
jgi:transposase-like protein